MRIWDIDPGFLNNQSLLGEHRELHGIASILTNNKKGYRNHPETIRWQHSFSALLIRHYLQVEEMIIRNYNHQSPIHPNETSVSWPTDYIDSPDLQFELLQNKYISKQSGRILLPKNIQDLWSKHKYSVMARNYNTYKTIGQKVAKLEISFSDLSHQLIILLRSPPSEKALKNSIYHMWGYVSPYSNSIPDSLSGSELIDEIRRLSLEHGVDYLIQSTAIGELGYWCKKNLNI